MRQNKLDGWQGPPGPFVYLITRSDAVDVVYGTMELRGPRHPVHAAYRA